IGRWTGYSDSPWVSREATFATRAAIAARHTGTTGATTGRALGGIQLQCACHLMDDPHDLSRAGSVMENAGAGDLHQAVLDAGVRIVQLGRAFVSTLDARRRH